MKDTNLTLRQKTAIQKSIHALTIARSKISEAHLLLMQAGLERPRINSLEIKERIENLETILCQPLQPVIN